MCLYVGVCVCVCVWLVRICGLVLLTSSTPPTHTGARPHPEPKRQSYTPPPTHIPSMKANSPPLDPLTHRSPTHPHTYLDSGCVTVKCLRGGGFCVCVCVPACVCGWVCADACMWVGVSMCSWVCGCVCLCVRACWCEVREGYVCVCVCVCVCVACAYMCMVWCSSHPHPHHTRTHAHTHKQTDNRKRSPRPPHTHPRAIRGMKPPSHPTHTHTLPNHTYAHTPA